MKSLRVIIAAVFFTSFARSSFAIDLGFAKQDGGQAGAFLDYAASARSLGMGRAQAAVTDDAGSTYWNPAGLARVDRRDILALYSALPESTNFSFVSYAQPTVDIGNFGAGVVSLQSGGFEKRDDSTNRTGSFSVTQTALLLSHGMPINDRMSFGSTVKVIRNTIDNFSGTGYGLDLGFMDRIHPKLQLAVVTHNLLAPKVKLMSHADTYPRDLRFGVNYQPMSKLTLASDLVKTQGRSIKLNLGAEYRIRPMFALRGGINETEIAAGFGLIFANWGLDYAFGYNDAVSGIADLGSSHRIGFHMNFGRSYSEEAASLRWKKKGQDYLDALRDALDHPDSNAGDSLKRQVDGAKQTIQHNGYDVPQDLYEAQAYIYFFDNDFERSFQSLNEAIALDPDSKDLEARQAIIRSHMDEEKSRKLIESEMASCKESFSKNDFRAALTACEDVLRLKPDHVEAKVYADDARKKIYEPIERELKIANAHFNQGEFLDVLKHLNVVRQMDPENEEITDLMNKTLKALDHEARPAATTGVTPDQAKSREFYGRGLVLYSQGKMQEAADAWNQAMKYDGGNALARNAYNRVVTEMREKAQ